MHDETTYLKYVAFLRCQKGCDIKMSFIKVDNITKTFKVAKRNSGLKAALKSFFKREYKIVEAVKNVSFEIKKGEVIGYIGPNGAGKSTTIKMLSGILLPTSGSIKINNLDPIKDRKKYVSKIGVVFGQRSQLAFDIPAEDTFDLLRDIYKIDNNEYQKTKKYLVELLGIEEINTETQNVQKKDNTPVIECETEKPVDKYEKGDSDKSKAKIDKGMSKKALEENLNNIPSKNFDIKKMLKNGLIEKVAGITKEDFNKLSDKEKNLIISAVKYSVVKFDALKSQGKINANASEEELITAFANVLFEALESGDFENSKDFENAIGDIVKDLGENFDKRPNKEQKRLLKERRLIAEQNLKSELEAIKELPEEERAAAEKRIRRRYRHIFRGRFLDITAQMNSECGVNAIILLDSKDMAFGAKTVLRTRCNQEEKTRTADYANYEFTRGLIKDYNEIGNPVEAEVLKCYTQTFMEQKSADAASEYQKNYKEDRNKYETVLKKQQNGQPLTDEEKELLAVMKSEYYTATAQGIGQGALHNVNMTSEQKAEFLSKWEEDAKQYSDYHQVVQNVKKEIAKNPEYKEVKTKFAEIKQEKSAIIPHKVKHIEKSNPEKKAAELTVVKTYSEQKAKAVVSNPQIKVKKRSNPIIIARDIQDCGIQEAIKTYGSNAIQVILDNSSFKHLRSKLTTIIRSYDLKSLIDITTNCSDSSFIYICSIVNKDFIPKLKENREHTKGLCYAADKQVKNIEGEYANI